MERIERIHYFIDKLKPEGQSGFISPETKDEAINFAILDIFRDLLPRYDTDLTIKATLRKFESRKAYTASEATSDGYPLPTNIQRINGAGGFYSGVEYDMDIMSEMEYRKRVNSKSIPPIIRVPICSIRGGYLVASPTDVLPVLYYLRDPASVKYNYTLQGSGGLDIVYNSSGSIHPELPESYDFEVVKGSLKYLGISLRDDMLTAVMEQLKKH